MASAGAGDIAGELMAGLAATWNQHDMHAFASLFGDDAAFANVAGGYLRGRGEIEKGHAAWRVGPFKNSALSTMRYDRARGSPDRHAT